MPVSFSICEFQLSDAIVKVDRHDADVDGFDDVFAEFLQTLVFFDLLLERTVKTAVFDSDRDIARKT